MLANAMVIISNRQDLSNFPKCRVEEKKTVTVNGNEIKIIGFPMFPCVFTCCHMFPCVFMFSYGLSDPRKRQGRFFVVFFGDPGGPLFQRKTAKKRPGRPPRRPPKKRPGVREKNGKKNGKFGEPPREARGGPKRQKKRMVFETDPVAAPPTQGKRFRNDCVKYMLCD